MPQMLGVPGAFARWAGSVAAGARRFDVKVWESASGCAPTSQDSWLVAQFDDWIRLAVLDGITPTAVTPRVVGLDGAAWAARVARSALETTEPAPNALAAANIELLTRPGTSQRLHRDRPHTMAAVVDITSDDAQRVTIAGDCQAFVAHNCEWRELAGGPLFLDAARSEWAHWRDQAGDIDPVDDIAEAYERILADPARWRSTAIGLFADPHFETIAVAADDWDEVVVASDGARLRPDVIADLGGWLDGLRQHERTEHAADYKPHDDVVVIHLRRE
jgi:hypothetical protein